MKAIGKFGIILIAVLLVPFGLTTAENRSSLAVPGNGVRDLSKGVRGISHAVENGDFGAASGRLAGLFDNGELGGAVGDAGAVYAGELLPGEYSGAYSQPSDEDSVVVVPPPTVDDAAGKEGRDLGGALLGFGALLLGAWGARRKGTVLVAATRDKKTVTGREYHEGDRYADPEVRNPNGDSGLQDEFDFNERRHNGDFKMNPDDGPGSGGGRKSGETVHGHQPSDGWRGFDK